METSIFQTPEWAEFKVQTGYAQAHWIEDLLVLEKKLPLERTMLYSPRVNKAQMSTIISPFSGKGRGGVVAKLKSLAAKSKAIFYRLELDIENNLSQLPNTNSQIPIGFRRAFEQMQPEQTLILDITKSEEEILAQMKPKGRYNIKVAERSNIIISSSNRPGPGLNNFYELYKATAKRQRITHREKNYFEALLEILGQKNYARVYIAQTQTENQNLAAAIVLYYNDKATYLFGGSSDEHRNLMAPYLLHWQIIKEARLRSMKKYDFFGVSHTKYENRSWTGITRFKKQFGGQEVQLLGSWDLVFRPIEYQVFKIAEKIRR